MHARLLPISLLALTGLSSMHGFSQHSGMGLKGGLLMSEMRSGARTSKMVPGATAGLYFPLRGGPRLEVQPELLLTTLGTGHTLPDGGRVTVRAIYAQLPVAAKLYIGNTFNAQVGLQLGRLLSAQQKTPDGSTTVTTSYNTIDGGFIVGAGADLISGVDITLRYYNGLKPVLRDDLLLFPRNLATMLTVGYRFTRLRPVKNIRRRR